MCALAPLARLLLAALLAWLPVGCRRSFAHGSQHLPRFPRAGFGQLVSAMPDAIVRAVSTDADLEGIQRAFLDIAGDVLASLRVSGQPGSNVTIQFQFTMPAGVPSDPPLVASVSLGILPCGREPSAPPARPFHTMPRPDPMLVTPCIPGTPVAFLARVEEKADIALAGAQARPGLSRVCSRGLAARRCRATAGASVSQSN